MPSYVQVLRRALFLTGVILLINGAVGFASTLLGFRATDVIGNLLLLETAALFIGAGILDFGTSVGITQLRRLILPGKEGFSLASRRESERRALILIVVGLLLSVIMILLALFDLGLR